MCISSRNSNYAKSNLCDFIKNDVNFAEIRQMFFVLFMNILGNPYHGSS